ncbi:MAG TPA: serine/threonine-protein kinase [Solirubrobacteraceae bacterium]|nr:serine/threonine-protein kinase [Solirubrobacteraceae bacterium]
MSHAHSSAAAPPGQVVLGRYRLGPRLGAGGMGVVYRARDEHLERDVAVKRIAIEHDPDGRGEREALAAARLSHAGIVALYESGRDEDAVYLVSELIDGPTLAELLRAGELSDRDVLLLGATLCGALSHAHARGVIHRDVKPSNIICPAVEEGLPTAKLTDFGIARMADHDVLTRTGDIIGTLAYMAPEQARGGKITGAADVYALGVVLYEALAGVNPVRAGNPAATARRVGTPLPPLGRVRRDLPADLCRAVDSAVAVDPAARTGLGALRRALEDAVDAVGDVPGPIAGNTQDTMALPALTPARTRRQEQRQPRPARRLRPVRPSPPPPHRQDDRHGHPYDDEQQPIGPAHRPRTGPLPRVVAALAAAGLGAGALALLGPQPPLQPAAGAALAGGAVFLLPRLGWLAAAAALLAWLAFPVPGVALILAVAIVPVAPLLARRGTAWSLPALAPALGLIGLAGAWPALAGQSSRWTVRAALGGLGGWWLALAEVLTSDRLVFGRATDPSEVLPRQAWEGSAVEAMQHGLWPMLAGGALGLVALWALAAVLLPLLVRGRSAALDIIAVSGWAAALAAATQALSEALVLDPPRGLVIGALAGGVVAVAARAVRGRA